MDVLRQAIHQQVPIQDTDWQLLTQHWVIPKSLQRNEYLYDLGSIGKHLYWVLKGTLKICYINKGEEICAGFCYPDTLACSYPSFISNKPTQYCIQAITPCQLVGISRQHFYEAIEQNIRLERAWRKITEQVLLGKIEREMDLITASPEERFTRLWKRSPHLFQLVPQRYIASYLRMTPETFSRIKSRVWKP
ncbi:Crp/Fnr family transcriptional regulator [Aureispira anguillae]|uniref:Crp/Fnr family transcriptional regulator n=1 Tax=Aureispira anguillae TaxID=2864201 RepID=A0A915YH11_9BACT|nr:Crp/Fnr family transcriptional regulator [Aureispira anguillae]BDS12923.1 Crp/Fnr family transcriptional regulator [Aureispira anguillae]